MAKRFMRTIPEGDDHERLVCQDCGFIHYENPKIVVGSVTTFEDRYLLCKRAIEPRRGFWTLPAGYMELGETAAQAARREAWEEARARIEIDALLAVYSLPHISQVQMMFRAHMGSADHAVGPESEEVRLVSWREIPWTSLAFPTVRWALIHARQVQGRSGYPPFMEAPPEAHPEDG